MSRAEHVEVVIDILRAFRLDEPHSLAEPQKPKDVPSPSEPFGTDDRNYREHDRQNRIFKDGHAEPTREDQTTTRGALYRVPEIVTRGRFPERGESDSTWRTQEARHVGSDTIAPGF